MSGTFEGVGSLQFTPDNKFCYGYSGKKTVNNNLNNMLEFTNGSEYLKIGIQYFKDSVTSENYEYGVTFNNIEILLGEFTSPLEDNPNIPNPVILIVPPFTNVKITLQNISDSSGRNWCVTLTGSVHGAIEQENLEAITDANDWAAE